MSEKSINDIATLWFEGEKVTSSFLEAIALVNTKPVPVQKILDLLCNKQYDFGVTSSSDFTLKIMALVIYADPGIADRWFKLIMERIEGDKSAVQSFIMAVPLLPFYLLSNNLLLDTTAFQACGVIRENLVPLMKKFLTNKACQKKLNNPRRDVGKDYEALVSKSVKDYFNFSDETQVYSGWQAEEIFEKLAQADQILRILTEYKDKGVQVYHPDPKTVSQAIVEIFSEQISYAIFGSFDWRGRALLISQEGIEQIRGGIIVIEPEIAEA